MTPGDSGLSFRKYAAFLCGGSIRDMSTNQDLARRKISLRRTTNSDMDGGDVAYRLWAAHRARSIRPPGKFQSAHQKEGVPMADTLFSCINFVYLPGTKRSTTMTKKFVFRASASAILLTLFLLCGIAHA